MACDWPATILPWGQIALVHRLLCDFTTFTYKNFNNRLQLEKAMDTNQVTIALKNNKSEEMQPEYKLEYDSQDEQHFTRTQKNSQFLFCILPSTYPLPLIYQLLTRHTC